MYYGIIWLLNGKCDFEIQRINISFYLSNIVVSSSEDYALNLIISSKSNLKKLSVDNSDLIVIFQL